MAKLQSFSILKLLLVISLFIFFFYIITNYVTGVSKSKLLDMISLKVLKPLKPCREPNATVSYRRAKELFNASLTLEDIDRIVLDEVTGTNCSYKTPKEPKIIIIVPYRNRKLDLISFLIHLIPYFKYQSKQMEVMIIEQNGTAAFNRAKLFNAGIRELQRISKENKTDRLAGSTCFAFHDVDKLPYNLDVPYGCAEGPRQLLKTFVNDNTTQGSYGAFLGGVTMFTMDQLEKINGASNSFEGWGGEDDDLWQRVHMVGMKVDQPQKDKGKFYEGDPNHKRDRNPIRTKLLGRKNQKFIMRNDGLQQTNYTLLSRVDYKTFVWLLVNL